MHFYKIKLQNSKGVVKELSATSEEQRDIAMKALYKEMIEWETNSQEFINNPLSVVVEEEGLFK